MVVLVINSGSSSLKFALFAAAAHAETEPRALLSGGVSELGSELARLTVVGRDYPVAEQRSGDVHAPDQRAAFEIVLRVVCDAGMPTIDAIGYRVVHPGATLHGHQRITPSVLAALASAAAFAPLHDPPEVALIHQGLERFADVPQYVCFDTEFHRTMPEEASSYAIPRRYRDEGVRRFGFHGLSCESVVAQMTAKGAAMPERAIIAHLGSGCSVTALRHGASIDTTMGMTPTGGVVMGTRPGDLDPGALLYLLRQQPGDMEQAATQLQTLLNKECGLVALSGKPNDMELVVKAAAEGDECAQLALTVFTRSIAKAMGGFCWLMGGVDAIAFTGGIGEHAPTIRAAILAGLEPMGVVVDPQRNEAVAHGMRPVGQREARVDVLVVPAQEERMIARHVCRLERLGHE